MVPFIDHVQRQVDLLRQDGFYKRERIIAGRQAAKVPLADGKQVLNFCANNYLGLADDPHLIDAAKQGLDRDGFGLASVRFICGTQTGHKALEGELAGFLGMDDAILYSSCFDANGGLFEVLLGEQDAVISDALNHASIIDGIRLSKAKRYRYANNDMVDLRRQLQSAVDAGARYKLIATDGVFSMDGIIANLRGICELAEEFDALVMVDDAHAVGFMGEHGRGTVEHCGVEGRVHILTGTLGKALGGRVRRLCRGSSRDRRVVAPALTPLLVFQYAGAGHRIGIACRAAASAKRARRYPQEAGQGKRPAISPGDGGVGL